MEEKRGFFQWILFGLEKFGEGICYVGDLFRKNWRVSFELRKVVMAVPVLVAMFALANECRQRLPEVVGINILATGQFEQMIPRENAITATMVITVISLVLMFCSRKTIYPWLVSVLTLVLPVLLILTNVFPM